MKRVVLIITVLIVLIILPACKYNGEATVMVKNVGDLTASVQIENAQLVISPGEEEEFTITWPGRDDMNLNLSTYPLAYKETMWENENFWIKNGETKYFEIEFYTPETTE